MHLDLEMIEFTVPDVAVEQIEVYIWQAAVEASRQIKFLPSRDTGSQKMRLPGTLYSRGRQIK